MSYYDMEIKCIEAEYVKAIEAMQKAVEWSDEWFAAADRVAELSDELWLRRNYSI